MIRFLWRCLGIFLEILFYIIVVGIIVFMVSCSSVPITGDNKCQSYKQTGKEIQDIIKNGDNLKPEQILVLKHAAAELKDAQKQGKQIAELQNKLIKSSEKAGAGKLVYYIMYFVVFLVAAFIGLKVMKRFGI